MILPALLLCFASSAWARPVSYYGGWTVETENRRDQNEGMLAYSLLPEISLGARFSAYRPASGDEQLGVLVANWLVQRWSLTDAMANLYLSGGFGGRRVGPGHAESAAFGGVEADWESRRIFFGLKAESVGWSWGEPKNYARFRTGLAPYLMRMDGFNTWLFLQLDYRSWRDKFAVTPLLRFTYQNVLFELGASLEGEAAFNWVMEL